VERGAFAAASDVAPSPTAGSARVEQLATEAGDNWLQAAAGPPSALAASLQAAVLDDAPSSVESSACAAAAAGGGDNDAVANDTATLRETAEKAVCCARSCATAASALRCRARATRAALTTSASVAFWGQNTKTGDAPAVVAASLAAGAAAVGISPAPPPADEAAVEAAETLAHASATGPASAVCKMRHSVRASCVAASVSICANSCEGVIGTPALALRDSRGSSQNSTSTGVAATTEPSVHKERQTSNGHDHTLCAACPSSHRPRFRVRVSLT
jgi:hypothetical protein